MGHWCSATWGRRSGQSCWTVCSCGRSQPGAPSRPALGPGGGGGVGGRRLVARGRRRTEVGLGPSSPHWRSKTRDEEQYLGKSSVKTYRNPPQTTSIDHNNCFGMKYSPGTYLGLVSPHPILTLTISGGNANLTKDQCLGATSAST